MQRIFKVCTFLNSLAFSSPRHTNRIYFLNEMGDSWEDWDEEDVAVPAVNGAPAVVDPKKFEDEDAEEEEPKWKNNVPKPQEVRKI